ncbi:hypothetical protein [Phaeobacter gallaeciensis]|uniref:Uncharacterized protein n=1 Tax=Phaeobacter gallaeciensis TaxID=60890 RepID=A0AAC9ZA46_9RHOB|nr:hypothetical protein [Phaeobacter gallaeciensis]AHD10060.1 hypothetical protein Gal_02314 [Phaeobacter gallaeciensis DSM 26640]ATE93324.1 hypothetical protein PhaeoP11_02305 [Phaeobacter gallaeciensis]ATE96855.1 hypothetical protein PhaeoP73_01542 [Phaeobacter gallaeciensis]ATF01988.1 hypothetical protein PhaeoP75_02354 [Phaeobacter gallaeciensis]ATF06368.1 hypothetical protein PhaeoP63_02303 [Phaeobacter gallaeciensis]
MQRFNTIKNLIVAPALVIALTAGSVMAGPGQHSGGTAHHGVKIGRPEMPRTTARQAAHIGTTVAGEMASHTTNTSSLGTTQNGSNIVLEANAKSLGLSRTDNDAYLDGVPYLLSARTSYANGFTDTSTLTGESDGTIKRGAEQKVQETPAIPYLNVVAFSVGAVLKFKQWQDNPTDMPIGTHIGVVTAAHVAQLWKSQSD